VSESNNPSLADVVPDANVRDLLNHLFTCAQTPTVLAHVVLGPEGKQLTPVIIGALVTAEAMLSRSEASDPQAGVIHGQVRRLYAALVHAHEKLQESGLDS
jgi:hypothetical protein